MELNALEFQARKRNAWQVFDLTLLVVHRWGLQMFFLWFLQALIIFVPMALIFDSFIALLIVWWLKPVIERPLLQYASQAAFGYKPGIGECLSTITKLGVVKIALMLTWRRLSLQRAFAAPVDQLEGLHGHSRSSRVTVLESLSNHRQALWLIFCVYVEFILMLAFSLVFFAMVPGSENIEFDVDLLFLYEDSIDIITTLGSLLSYGVIAPYYVTGGFLGYLNSRVELEGWDIELAFKRMAKRLAPVLLLVLCTPFLFGIYDNNALASTVTVEDVETVERQIQALYSNTDVVVISQTWQPTAQIFNGFDMDIEWLVDVIKWLFKVFTGDYSWFATFFWGAIILLLGFVLWKLLRLPLIKLTPVAKHLHQEIPQFVSTIETRNIPDDLLAAASLANSEGNSRLALTWLLYHGLSCAQIHYGVALSASMTEGECELALKSSLSADAFSPYSDLFQLWMTEAWAHQKASTESIEQLISSFTKPVQANRSELCS